MFAPVLPSRAFSWACHVHTEVGANWLTFLPADPGTAPRSSSAVRLRGGAGRRERRHERVREVPVLVLVEAERRVHVGGLRVEPLGPGGGGYAGAEGRPPPPPRPWPGPVLGRRGRGRVP